MSEETIFATALEKASPTDRAAYGRLCRLLTLGRRRAPKGECRLQLCDFLECNQGMLAGVDLVGNGERSTLNAQRSTSNEDNPVECWKLSVERWTLAPLRLDDVLTEVRTQNPTLAAARERARAAAAAPARASAYDDPTVSWEAWNVPNSFAIDRADLEDK